MNSVKIVYLDTSNIAMLANVRRSKPERFASFLKCWKSLKCILGISEIHFFEIARHASDTEKDSRFLLLNEMMPIRLEPYRFPKEIVKGLRAKGISNLRLRGSIFGTQFFSQLLCLAEDLKQFDVNSSSEYAERAENSYKIMDALWQLELEVHKGNREKKVRVGNLSNSMPQSLEDRMRAFLNFDSKFRIYQPSIRNQFDFLLKEGKELGFRTAFSNLLGLNPMSEKDQNRPLMEITNELVFRNSVAFILSKVLVNRTEEINEFTAALSLNDCVGQWLKINVEMQMRKNNDLTPGNESDTSHIAHLPYVDLFVTDKRVATFTKQVLKSTRLPATLKTANPPFAISNTIEALEDALNS